MRMASIAYGRSSKADVTLSSPAAPAAPAAGFMAVMMGTGVIPIATLGLMMRAVDDLIEKYIENNSKIGVSFTSSKATISTIRLGKAGITYSQANAQLLAETAIAVGYTAAAAGFSANNTELMLEGLTQCRNVLYEFLRDNNIAGIGT